jgi:hypothetical protein
LDDLAQIDEALAAPEVEADALDQIDDLLNEPEGVQAAEPTGDSDTEEEGTEETQEETPDGVDYDLAVPIANGDPVTLGQLKDHWQDSQKNIVELQERENAVMQQMNELQEMSQYTQLPPEKLAVIKQQQEQYLAKEHSLMLEAIPAFKDQTAFVEAKKGIDALATEYGIQEQIANVSDHRIVKMLHDFATLKSNIKSAANNVKPLRSKTPQSRNKAAGKVDAATAAQLRAAKTGNPQDQLAAIDALLN